jgi:hypothetical protein
MTVFYGSDSYCVSDIGLTDIQVTDPALLIGQRIARLLQTPRGGLAAIGDDPDRGWDCRQYINMKLTPAAVSLGQQQVLAECRADEQVQDGAVEFVIDSTGALQQIAINLLTSAGPFTLTGNVNTITGALIFAFGS